MLRYLADAYKALRQTVPEDARTEELDRPHRVARRAGPPGRLQPARRVGAAAQPAPAERRPSRRGAAAARSPATCGRSGCWCATRCSAGSSWPRCAATTSSASWTARPAGTPTAWADALDAVLRGARRDRHRPGRARPGACCIIETGRERWRVRQIFDDPAGDHDWGITRRGRPGRVRRGRRRRVRITDVGQL